MKRQSVGILDLKRVNQVIVSTETKMKQSKHILVRLTSDEYQRVKLAYEQWLAQQDRPRSLNEGL